MRRQRIDLRTMRPERVCLLKPSSLGDVVHTLPVLSALRALWPGARISWVVNRGLSGLLDGHPDLDDVIPFDRATARPSPGGLVAVGRFLADLRRRRFDLVIDLQGLLRSGLMAIASGAPFRVGFAGAREGAAASAPDRRGSGRFAGAREGADRFYTHRIPNPTPEPHAVERLLAVARAFGAETTRPCFVVPMATEDRRWACEALAGTATPRLVLNVGARWRTKRWPPEHFAAVARRAVERFGAGLVAVGAPEDRPLIAALRARLDPIPLLDLCGRTTLPQLAAVAVSCDLFLSNDTGPLHLAAAAGARVIGVYTCTRPEWTGPYGPRAVAVRSGVWCAGRCVKACDRMECMAELTPDRVWPAVRSALDDASSSPSAA